MRPRFRRDGQTDRKKTWTVNLTPKREKVSDRDTARSSRKHHWSYSWTLYCSCKATWRRRKLRERKTKTKQNKNKAKTKTTCFPVPWPHIYFHTKKLWNSHWNFVCFPSVKTSTLRMSNKGTPRRSLEKQKKHRSKHMERSKEHQLLAQNTTCESSGQSPLSSDTLTTDEKVKN